MTNIEQTVSAQVYRTALWFRLCIVLLDLIIVVSAMGACVSLLQETGGDSVAIFAGVILLLFMIAFALGSFLAVREMRLELTADGIAFYAWGYRMYTPWNNIAGVEESHAYGTSFLLRSFMGLTLHHDCVLGISIEEGKRQSIAVIETDWWTPGWSMQRLTNPFPIIHVIAGRHWLHGPLGKEIQHYVPRIGLTQRNS